MVTGCHAEVWNNIITSDLMQQKHFIIFYDHDLIDFMAEEIWIHTELSIEWICNIVFDIYIRFLFDDFVNLSQ